MQVSVESTGSLERKMHVKVPEDRIQGEVHSRLQSLSRTTRIQGFRPGKAPLKVVQQHYGSKIRQEVVGEFVQSSFYEAVTQEKLRPAGQPIFDPLTSDHGQGLTYTATFEIYPDISLTPIEELKIEKPVCQVGDDDLVKMVDVLRKQRSTMHVVDREAQNDDVLIIDFKGMIDGEVFAGGEASDFRLELGSKRFIPGFEEGLLKAKAGAEISLDLNFPDEYPQKEHAGKPVTFEVSVKEVNEQKLAELDDEFFASLGTKEGGLDAFKVDVKSNMEREAEQTLLNNRKNIVLDALLAANKIDLPKSMVTHETSRLQQQFSQSLQAQGMKVEDIPLNDVSMFIEQAEKRVALQMIIADIVKNNEIKADPAQVRSMIEKAAQSYEDSNEVVNWYYNDQNRLVEIEALVLEDEVVKWVLAKAQVEEHELTFDALMNKGQTDKI